MNKTTYSHIIDQLIGIEILLVMEGADASIIEDLLKHLRTKKYTSHQDYLIQLASGLLKSAEAIEQYKICTTIKRLIDKLNATDFNYSTGC